MKTIFNFLITFLTLGCLTSTTLAEDLPHPDKPMLWKIEGKDLKKPSYLFGTIHLSNPKITTLHPAAEAAFDQASSIHTEVKLDIASQLKTTALFLRKDGKTLSDSIGPKLTERVNEQLAKINPLLKVDGFNQFRTWFLFISLYSLEDQLQGKQALDMQLWNRATKAKKQTKALETAEGQLGQLNKLTEKEQIALLDATLESMENVQQGKEEDPLKKMINAYLEGNTDQLEKLIFEELELDDKIEKELLNKLNRLMFDERNERMAQSIVKQLKEAPEESHFFAAGTGHYLGDKSVNKFVEEAGYTITRVTK